MKLLAADYDGTLKYLDHVTKDDLDAIKKWRDQGNLFVIDTGRPMRIQEALFLTHYFYD